jgi:colanic acid biosynthesis glycosyl transferase WcaI
MKILMVVANFIPEIGSAAHIYFDLGRTFVNRGHEVDVITSYPREFNLHIADRSKQFPLEETIDGIHIHRVVHPHNRDNIIFRGLEHFLLSRYYFKKYKNLGKKFDACLIYIPPLPLYYLAKKIKTLEGTPSVLNFQDFHPQELTDVGVLSNPLMIKILEYIETQAYAHADHITVLSQKGMEYIIHRGGNPEKITHVYNGILRSDCKNFFISEDFKRKEGIEEKFLISYVGILSPFQGIDNILAAARDLAENKDIIFYIVGDGMIKDHLARRIADENLTNVRLLPLQPRNEYYNIIRSSDINLISLDVRMKAPCLPGKTVNLFAAGKPVIAIVRTDSETAYIMNMINPELVTEPGNSAALKNAIIHLKNNPDLRAAAGKKQRQIFEDQMNLEENVITYERIMENLVRKSSQSARQVG